MDEWLPQALSIGVPYKLFFHLSPRKLKAFDKAYLLKAKNKDREMLLQASYIYEAFSTVMANAFSKKKVDWRTKTYSEEYEEWHRPQEEKDVLLRQEFASDMAAARRRFLHAKQVGELTE